MHGVRGVAGEGTTQVREVGGVEQRFDGTGFSGTGFSGTGLSGTGHLSIVTYHGVAGVFRW
ncbi:hypothetical protein [uncultured Jatrophihabitans sp.]|uniref:hypothetical protein n=1 Tax=uncultured Jatrophihabitans sp. TaxID=1610747 RepID=UPI0035C9E4EC